MKPLYKLIVYFLFIFMSMGITKAQTTVYYSYDNNGNRILRTITLPSAMATQSSKKSGIDSTYLKEEIKENKVEDQISDQKIKIYPNPTRGALRVEILGFDPSQQATIRVFNLKGSLIISLDPLSGNDIVDLSANPLGIYILKVQLGEKVSEWKIIKE